MNNSVKWLIFWFIVLAAAIGIYLYANAREHSDVKKADALDRAAPFSLSFAAPVTEQFVLEDHAVRHSWHHLYRIRAVVGR